MLRINLLPSYVTQRRLTKRLVPVFALLVILSVALPLLWYASLKAHLTDVTSQAEQAETQKNANDALEAQAKSTKAQVQPIQDKLDFVTAVHKHNTEQIRTLSAVANESPRKSLIYSSMTPGAGYSSMTINAYSPSVEEIGRYLQAMYQAPVFSSVAVDRVPGYPDNVQHRWYLGKTMVFADGATNTAAGGGGGGYPGGSGGGAPAAGGAFSAASLAPNGPANVPPGVGPPPPELVAGLATGAPTGGGYPGGAGAAQGGGYSANFLRLALAGVSPFATPDVQARILQSKLRQVRRVTIPKGFNVTVTATVAPPYAPLTAPTPPGSAPAAGAGGFPGGGAPGYPGGSGPPSYPGGSGPPNYPGGAGGYPGGKPTG